ncbi:MAG: PBSX family phage terminase large subunit [Clostridiales bacterium]|nr:PBSX family phage terminase large subunit [Clostridiales bacterium]
MELDRLATAAQWYLQLRESSNAAFLPLFADTHRYLVLMGGGGSGKSIFAGRKVLERCAAEAGHRYLVCRKVARTLQESCFGQLCSQAQAFYPGQLAQISRSNLQIRFQNGSEILFAGLDDVEKLKSIYNITGIWIEEASELAERDFNQLDIRLRGQTPFYKQIILSFNPISVNHWLKRRFFDRTDPDARVHHSTYRDNRFLDDAAKRVLEAYRDTDPYYYTVYCLGQWGVTGRTVFDAPRLLSRLRELTGPRQVGQFAYDYDGLRITNIRWVEDPGGFIRIYQAPREGCPYVIGGDTAGEGSDQFVGQVIDNTTGEQAAVLRHTFDEDLYARQMYCLGMYYNRALIAVEVNYSTYPQKELERLGYPRFYMREVEDDAAHRVGNHFGFRTTSLTRPAAIANLVAVVREHTACLNDPTTIDEMLSFIRTESMRAEAAEGAHDDCVMALAIAYYCRMQQRTWAQRPRAERAVWTRDMFEDYERADRESRSTLLELWGNPF